MRISSSSHWGGFRVARDGAHLTVTPRPGDPDPSPLLDYQNLGVTTFLIRGYDPLDDTIDHGRDLIPTLRTEILRREAPVPVPA